MGSILFDPQHYTPYPGVRVNESPYNEFLAGLAQSHAAYMAQYHKQGHQNWGIRYQQIRAVLGNVHAQEVCAESWPWQSNDPLGKITADACRSWHYSEGHWAVVSEVHSLFGDGLHKGKNGVYYSCIIVVDNRTKGNEE